MNLSDSETKKFSTKLHDENDMIAKITAVDFLESTGFYYLETKLNEQQEAYKDFDFKVKLIANNKDVRVEVERKKVWTSVGKWQGWNTIDIPYRKSNSLASLFIMINNSADTLAITRMSEVLNSPVSLKKTIYTKNEAFFNVGLDKFKFYTKNNGNWVEVSFCGELKQT